MENESVNPQDGIRFAGDLGRIRERRGLTLEDLVKSTRIPEGILRSLETNALFDHPAFNRVYLRSIVRGYAAEVDVEESDILDALEQALIGMYRGALARKYLGEAENATDRLETGGETAEPTGIAAAQAPAPDDQLRARRITREQLSDERPEAEDTASVPRSISSTPSPSIPTSTAPLSPSGVFIRTALVKRIVVAIVLITLAIAAIFLVRALRETGAEAVGPSNERTDEAAAVPITPTPVESAAAVEQRTATVDAGIVAAVGDSVEVLIVSLGRPVREIRIRVDDDLRRPYWIERDSVLSVHMRERIIVENHQGLVEVRIPATGYASGRLRVGAPLTLRRSAVE